MVLAQVQMPLMVLPILTVMSKIDQNLADASRVLGAGEWRRCGASRFRCRCPA